MSNEKYIESGIENKCFRDINPNHDIDKSKPNNEVSSQETSKRNDQNVEDLIDSLIEFNPDRQSCHDALSINNYDIEKASEYLLLQMIDNHCHQHNDHGPVNDLTDYEIKMVVKSKPHEMPENIALELFIDCNKNIDMFNLILQ